MSGIVIGLLLPVLVLAGIVYLGVRRGFEIRELCDHGVAAAGRIVGKRFPGEPGATTRQKKLVYEYSDRTGTIQSHTSVVSLEVYQTLNEGDIIEVVYSSKRPESSAPECLIDQCRKALSR